MGEAGGLTFAKIRITRLDDIRDSLAELHWGDIRDRTLASRHRSALSACTQGSKDMRQLKWIPGVRWSFILVGLPAPMSAHVPIAH